eukprot:5302510-Prymnesium_polylepis.1
MGTAVLRSCALVAWVALEGPQRWWAMAHGRRGLAGRARWSGPPPGAAQSAAPFGPLFASFV